MGFMYANGADVIEENLRAHNWCNISASRGLDKSSERKDQVTTIMPPEDISQAQALPLE